MRETLGLERLLDAYREEFRAECARQGMTPEEVAECLADFERETLQEAQRDDG
jgi:hypothetical protein